MMSLQELENFLSEDAIYSYEEEKKTLSILSIKESSNSILIVKDPYGQELLNSNNPNKLIVSSSTFKALGNKLCEMELLRNKELAQKLSSLEETHGLDHVFEVYDLENIDQESALSAFAACNTDGFDWAHGSPCFAGFGPV